MFVSIVFNRCLDVHSLAVSCTVPACLPAVRLADSGRHERIFFAVRLEKEEQHLCIVLPEIVSNTLQASVLAVDKLCTCTHAHMVHTTTIHERPSYFDVVESPLFRCL